MRVAIIREGVWKPSKYDYGRNRRVTMENVDNPKEYVYLNLTEAQGVVDKWALAIKEGNVLDVRVHSGTNQVDKFAPFTIIKSIEREE